MQPTKVLIVDDHALFQQGVRNVIEPQEDFEVVGEAEDGMEALAKARELKPDLIIMDIHMPHCNGLEAVSAIKTELPAVKIIVLTAYDEDENRFEATKRGAEGFLSKKVRAKALLDSLRVSCMKGETAISGPMAGKIELQLSHRHSERPKELVLSEVEGSGATEGSRGISMPRPLLPLQAEIPRLATLARNDTSRGA